MSWRRVLAGNNGVFGADVPCKLRQKLKKKLQSPRLHPIQPDTSRRNPNLDAILSRDASFRFLFRTKSFLSRLPDHSIPLPLAGKLHRELGFPRGRKPSRLALQHPLLLRLSHDPPSLSFTSLMQSLLLEERSIYLSLESRRILTVQKLLMMSRHRRIPLAKLHHCRAIFGLPDDFRDRVRHYPNLFRIHINPIDDLHELELVDWDPSLAVSALERQFIEDEERIRKLFKFPIPRRRYLDLDPDDAKQMDFVTTFPLVSPYSDGWKHDLWTVEAEKYRVGIVHEFLSLTLEKRAMIHHVVEFKEEFSLTKHTYQMLVKQPRAFYLAGTEMNWAAFLKDEYREDGTLIEKDAQVMFEEKLRRYAGMTQKDFSGNVGDDPRVEA
ncbi:protein WHAT'S THIS FACTOR 1 homolog, chloroplastic [Dioscorea cayenensis subsp. rotundata]|uniref:Protein WHAT'S THIS FACTOR 1 homolog, chloroplastic n=1 Tax=Dioscorea cayennensis subsp. rotundata TaxID=55577 RepID=A0AB40AHE6_DIOCR|nr:protein WHAT'S THIS FACTOR 1 homolog, chloroplastic [Dioscorea cayenensis subsp. rotundata]